MRERVAALHFQIQLVDEREKCLVVKQKLLDFRTKGRVFLAVEEEFEAETVGFLKADEGLGAASRQCKANRRILRELFAFLAPIFHQGDV